VSSKEARVIDLSPDDVYQPLLSGSPETCGMRSGRQALAPGSECGEHSTKAHEEVLVVLEGQGLARLGDGSIVTSEKGLSRVKVYSRRGAFIGVVAPPTAFTAGSRTCRAS